MPGIYRSTYAEEGQKEPIFLSAQAWRPSTYYEQCVSSFIPPTAAAVAVTTQYAAVANRSPPSSIIVLRPASNRGGGHKRCRRCPVSIDLYMLRRARRNLLFYPPKLGDPPPTTSNVIAPLNLPLLLQSPSLRSTQRWPTDRRPVVLKYCVLHQTGRAGSSLPSPGFGFI